MNPKNKYYTTEIQQARSPDKKEAKEKIKIRTSGERPRENNTKIQGKKPYCIIGYPNPEKEQEKTETKTHQPKRKIHHNPTSKRERERENKLVTERA